MFSAETLHLPARPVSIFRPHSPQDGQWSPSGFPAASLKPEASTRSPWCLPPPPPSQVLALPPSSGSADAALLTLLFPSLCTRDLPADPTNSAFKTQPESSHVLSRHPHPPSRRPMSFLVASPDQPPNWSTCILAALPDMCSRVVRQAAGMLLVKCRSDRVSHLCSEPSSGFPAQSKSQSLSRLTSQTPCYPCVHSRCAVPAPRAAPLPRGPCTLHLHRPCWLSPLF